MLPKKTFQGLRALKTNPAFSRPQVLASKMVFVVWIGFVVDLVLTWKHVWGFLFNDWNICKV